MMMMLMLILLLAIIQYSSQQVCNLGFFHCPVNYSPNGCCYCTAGNYCDGANLIPCPAGTYNPSTGSTSSQYCTPCSPGFYSISGQSACAPCSAGTYNPSYTQSACISCSEGTYNPSTGSTSSGACTTCSAGTYSISGQSLCTPCSAGTYNPSTGSTSSGACTSYSAGTYNPSTGSTSSEACIPCIAGTYNPSTGSTSSGACTPCSEGTYNPRNLSSACISCSAGTYNPSTGSNSSEACISCSEGTYNPSTGSTSSGACTPCSEGTYNPSTGSTSSGACTSCSAGTYNPSTGSTSSEACIPCIAGTYNPSTGSTSSGACTPCSEGTYNPRNLSSACISCSAGTYNPSTGSNSSEACISCSAGTYNPSTGGASSSSCTSCPPGTYQLKVGSSNCTAYDSLYQCTLASTSRGSNIGSISLLLMIPFALIGGLIYYIRSKSSNLEVLSVSSIALTTALLGLDLVSDLIFVILLLSGALLKPRNWLTLAGTVFIFARFIHPLAVMLTIGNLFGIGINKRDIYLKHLDVDHWEHYSSLYSCIVLLTIVESSLIKYLPWVATSFCKKSGGYPDLLCFRLCSYGKLWQSIIATAIQASVLVLVNADISSSCSFVLVLSLSSSAIPLVITGIEVMFQATTLVDLQSQSSHDNKIPFTTNPITDVESKLPNEMVKRISETNSSATSSNRISETEPSTTSSTIDNYVITLSTRSMTSLEFKQELIRYYTSVAPAMITNIESIMTDYKGDEQDLLDTLKDTYNKPVLSYTIVLESSSLSSADFYKGLVRYFKIVAPEQVNTLDSLMLEYCDREQDLVSSLQKSLVPYRYKPARV